MKFLQLLYSGGANKAVVAAAGALLNGAITGHWGSVQEDILYAVTVLVWLLPNVQKASEK